MFTFRATLRSLWNFPLSEYREAVKEWSDRTAQSGVRVGRALHRITHYRGSAFFISTASSLIHCAGSIFLVPRQSNPVIHHGFKPPRPTFADSGRLTSSRPSGAARHHGKPCGAYVGWPRNTAIIPPKMGERIVRPSMYDCHRDFHLAVQTSWKAPHVPGHALTCGNRSAA